MPGSTQSFIQFDHIRNGVIVLRNGDLRVILEVFAMNFGLKSVEEQEAIIYAYQNFLNSLDFDLQIVVHSRRMDITSYLKDLTLRAEAEENPLMRGQIKDYVAFVESFVQDANIMAKRFLVVVPYSIVQGAKKSSGFMSAVEMLVGTKKKLVHVDNEHFKAARTQLLQRTDFVSRSLEQVGLSTQMLQTEDLLRLFWEIYNPSRREHGQYLPTDISALEETNIS